MVLGDIFFKRLKYYMVFYIFIVSRESVFREYFRGYKFDVNLTLMGFVAIMLIVSIISCCK